MIWNSIAWYKAIREIDDNHSSPLYEISRESTIHPSKTILISGVNHVLENIVFQIIFSLNVPFNNRDENSSIYLDSNMENIPTYFLSACIIRKNNAKYEFFSF